MSLCVTVAGVELKSCIYNASGPRTGVVEALEKISKSESAAVLSKSATLNAQTGNDYPRLSFGADTNICKTFFFCFFRYKEIGLGPDQCVGSINSEGLPNKGIDYYLSPEVVEKVTEDGKPYFISLSGHTKEDNLEMLSRAFNIEGVSAIELNLACPNVVGKPIVAYDFEQMDSVLEAVTSHKDWGKKPLGIKVAPYFDMPHFEKAAKIINKYPISFVVCINTVGNALIVDGEAEQPLIAPKGGHGGLGGGFVKHTAMANVRQMRAHLKKEIDVIGAGGIRTGMDAFEFILCGATAVQIGTCHKNEGPSCFKRISEELKSIMTRKGYAQLQDFRGKLRDYDRSRATKPAREFQSSETPMGISSFIIALLCLIIAILIADKLNYVQI
eukprot:m.31320 g.31320  ORF g.31320 m.31320 type:complete len:386 (-) comp8302_c0_seq1:95-1252(-)